MNYNISGIKLKIKYLNLFYSLLGPYILLTGISTSEIYNNYSHDYTLCISTSDIHICISTSDIHICISTSDIYIYINK
jgi:hypothetical protein